MLRIGVDLMGGESNAQELFLALESFCLEEAPNGVSFVFYAHPELAALIQGHSSDSMNAVACSQFVAMEDNPLTALRLQRDASMFVALQELRDNKIDAVISTGNTGALVAGAHLALERAPGVIRAPLLAFLPTEQKDLFLLDVGALVDCIAEHLVQFACLGIALHRARYGTSPTVGLLNIGQERYKGTSSVQHAFHTLSSLVDSYPEPFTFLGNVEGHRAYSGEVDILVTSGFVGNTFLKTSEGLVRFLMDKVQREVAGTPSEEAIAEVCSSMHYSRYSGAMLCGVNKLVIKCHGSSNGQAIESGIRGALDLLRKGIMESYAQYLHLDRT